MVTKKPTAAERIKALVTASVTSEAKTEKLKKSLESVPKKNGGRRPGSGRKPSEAKLLERGVQQWVDEHINEQVDVQITDKKGNVLVLKKPRVAVVLQKLYQLAVTGDGSIEAIKAWLDRAVGRPVQPLSHGFDKDKPLRLVIDL